MAQISRDGLALSTCLLHLPSSGALEPVYSDWRGAMRSVEMAVRSMHDFGLAPCTCGVYFGQLLGMADHLSNVLGRHGYRAYKCAARGLAARRCHAPCQPQFQRAAARSL